MKKKKTGFLLIPAGIIAGLVLAAAIFVANNQPYGYISAPVLSSQNFTTGNVVAYTPWFENGTFQGDILSFPVSVTGEPNLLAPFWRASVQVSAQNYLTGRRIVTTDGAGTAIPFLWGSLTAAQQAQLGSSAFVNFVRGDRSNEGSLYRQRSSVLGDIIHSNPQYVQKPVGGYVFDNYLAFAAANATRPARIYSGHNDGMLHAWDAVTGDEVFAYIPSMLINGLTNLGDQPYIHTYYVDGPLTVEDAYFGGTWHTVLVVSLAAGGKGLAVLDITHPTVVSEADAESKILWEVTPASAGLSNLGNTYSRASVVRLNNDQWAVVIGNGYLSTSGAASLLVLDIETGSVIRELIVPDAVANGLSSPTLIDTDGDIRVDFAYAGDLNGNIWKFDLSGANPASWSVVNSTPFFQTDITSGIRQPITTALQVGSHPDGGYMIYAGTGRLFSTADAMDKTPQAVYGLWDNNWSSGDSTIDPNLLVTQELRSATHVGTGAAVRTLSNNPVDWNSNQGWKTVLEIAGASVLDQGERVLQDLLLRDNRVQVMSSNPTLTTGDNWYLQLDAFTGGAPSKTIVDINGDFALSVTDNVDGNGDATVGDTPEDRVIGEYQNFGLASRPVIGITGPRTSAALINHLVAINPSTTNPFPDDPGLLGGHFDLDTSSQIYPFDGGTTDGHINQWDDKYAQTTINFFDILDLNEDPLSNIDDALKGVDPNTPFILTVANASLSPGGVLEINGASVGVVEYQTLITRYLNGLLGPGETFPIYKLTPPTATEAAAGVIQLQSFKLSFDAFAILSGDLIPTNTGCVRSNNPGALGEYRNGALMVQALNAANVQQNYVLDVPTSTFVGANNSVNANLGYAVSGLFWEATVFWHWEGPCYGEAGFDALFQACVIQQTATCTKQSDDKEKDDDKKKKGKKKKKKKKDDDDDDDDDGDGDGDSSPGDNSPPPAPSDPGHSVTNTTVADDNDVGRLFWRELVPDN